MLSFSCNLRVDLFFEMLGEIFILHRDREKNQRKLLGKVLFFYLVTENKNFFPLPLSLPKAIEEFGSQKAMFRAGLMFNNWK